MSISIFSTLTPIIRRRIVFASVIVVAITVIGAAGFRYFEQLKWLDSFYASVQTVTTVGYGDLAPTTAAGRLFAILLMLTGVGTVLYTLTVVAQTVIQSEIVEAFGLRRKMKEMEKLEDHYIVCGAGRVGRRIIRNLQGQKLSHVIIEHDEKKLVELDSEGSHFIIGDATSEETLIKAGVKQARGLASCLPDELRRIHSRYEQRRPQIGERSIARPSVSFNKAQHSAQLLQFEVHAHRMFQ